MKKPFFTLALFLVNLSCSGLASASDPDLCILETTENVKTGIFCAKKLDMFWQKLRPVCENLKKLASDHALKFDSSFDLSTKGINFCQQMATLDDTQPKVCVRMKNHQNERLSILETLGRYKQLRMGDNSFTFGNSIVVATEVKIPECKQFILKSKFFPEDVNSTGELTTELTWFKNHATESDWQQRLSACGIFFEINAKTDELCDQKFFINNHNSMVAIYNEVHKKLHSPIEQLGLKILSPNREDLQAETEMLLELVSLGHILTAANELFQQYYMMTFTRAALYAYAAQHIGFLWPYPVFEPFGLFVRAPQLVYQCKGVSQYDGVVLLNEKSFMLRLLPGEKHLVLRKADVSNLNITLGDKEMQIECAPLNRIFYAVSGTLEKVSFAGETVENKKVWVTSDTTFPPYMGLKFMEEVLGFEINPADRSLHIRSKTD